MVNLIKKADFLVVLLIVGVLGLTSCDASDKPDTRYVAARLVDSDMWSIVDVDNGKILYKDEFRSQPTVIVNDKFCVRNASGLYDYFTVDNVTKPINKEGYLYATAFNENDVALAVQKGKGISVIDGDCEVIADLDHSIVYAGGFANGFSIVSNDNGKYGYINEKGKVVIKPIYDRAANFSADGLAIVGREVNDSTNKYSVIDAKGKTLFSFSSSMYKDFGAFCNGYLPVQKKNGEVVLLDKKGKRACSIGKWKGYVPNWLGFNDGVIVFKDGDAYGLKDEKGEIVMRAKYEELYPLPRINSGYYLAKKQDRYGVVDKKDNVVIPFDYDILSYVNKDILIDGDSDYFSFMNERQEDVGHNNYTNLSMLTGSAIYSNYFDAQKEARKIIANIKGTTFFKTHKGMVLRDFKDKLSGYKYADMDEYTLHDYDYPFSFVYGFDRHLSSQRYEYIYGYRFPTSPEYNYNANLSAVCAVSESFEDYQPGSEEALAKAFDSQIREAGFKPVDGRPHWYGNDKGMAVAIGYDDGTVSVMCAYQPALMEIEVTRNSRDDAPGDDAEVDYVDTFGLDKSEIVVEDVVTVDSTVAATAW